VASVTTAHQNTLVAATASGFPFSETTTSEDSVCTLCRLYYFSNEICSLKEVAVKDRWPRWRCACGPGVNPFLIQLYVLSFLLLNITKNGENRFANNMHIQKLRV
jgi:hypothetical protein